MRRWLTAVLGAAVLSTLLALPALAHPLGNFTINRFSRIQLTGSQINLLYVLDYAEIPAFQEKQRINDDGTYLDRRIRTLVASLSFAVDGHPVPLRVADRSLTFLPGQGGLQTMRLQVLLTASATRGSHRASYRDGNYPGRLGWKEIVVVADHDARLAGSTAPATSVSDELRRYPQDMLASPLNVTAASFGFTPSGATVAAPSLPRTSGVFSVVQDRFNGLITQASPSPWLLTFSLLAAIALGALHALSPGHGKAVMAGYLVGTSGRRRQAVVLGTTITATHTAGVFGLGLITLYAANLVTPERLYPWLTLLSGVLILGIGGGLLVNRIRAAVQRADGHEHEHGVGRIGARRLIALGISGGLIPCPSALVVLLAAISLHRVLFGMLLIVGFSAGLALVLTGLGLALAGGFPILQRAGARIRPAFARQGLRLAPVASAAIVTLAGAGLTVQALGTVL